MIDPTKCVERILNDEVAEELIDLLLQAVEPEFKNSNEFDEILDMAYLKLEHYRIAREAYLRSRAA